MGNNGVKKGEKERINCNEMGKLPMRGAMARDIKKRGTIKEQ